MVKGTMTQDATMKLGIREGMMHRLLGHPILGLMLVTKEE